MLPKPPPPPTTHFINQFVLQSQKNYFTETQRRLSRSHVPSLGPIHVTTTDRQLIVTSAVDSLGNDMHHSAWFVGSPIPWIILSTPGTAWTTKITREAETLKLYKT